MTLLICTLFFLLSATSLAASSTALLRIGKYESKELFKQANGFFFFQHLLPFFFKGAKWDSTLFAFTFTKQLVRIAYAISALLFLVEREPFSHLFNEKGVMSALWALAITGMLIGALLLAEFAFSLVAMAYPRRFFCTMAPLNSLMTTLSLPLTAPLFPLLAPLFSKKSRTPELTPLKLHERIWDVLQESEESQHLDTYYKKLILSVVTFKDRIAREVMVPRIDVYSLSADTSVEEAAISFVKEGYSRIPVYKESVDHIIGVLLYKDISKIVTHILSSKEDKIQLQAPIEHLVKPILYTPETKKISQLLQEFRMKHIHLAIVVDEYGGTEGIVTFEDILEELVGEIADEYDVGEEILYTPLPSGGWIVDARMTILSIADDLGIIIPPGPEYDTIGGFIYHRSGSIPTQGWRIHHENFDLEILSSDERSIDKIRITPQKKQ